MLATALRVHRPALELLSVGQMVLGEDVAALFAKVLDPKRDAFDEAAAKAEAAAAEAEAEAAEAEAEAEANRVRMREARAHEHDNDNEDEEEGLVAQGQQRHGQTGGGDSSRAGKDPLPVSPKKVAPRLPPVRVEWKPATLRTLALPRNRCALFCFICILRYFVQIILNLNFPFFIFFNK